jgi:hypothetical protein
MKYELPSIELIVIEENNYLKFGEYLNDMQCDDTANKLKLNDLEYVKKLQQKNEKLKDNWDKLKEYIRKTKLNEFEKSYGKRYSKTFTQAEVIVCNIIIDHMQELERVDK